MNTEDFVAHVRERCVDGLVEEYSEMLTNMAITSATDPGIRELAQVWKAASPELKTILRSYIRLGSQNTAAMILAMLEEDLGHAELLNRH